MPRLGVHLVLLSCLALPACATTQNDMVRRYNEDGVVLFSRGDYRHALESFELAYTFTPQDPSLIYNLAQCHERMGDWQKAEQHYTQCLQIAPTHGDAKFAYASLLYRTTRSAQADRMIEDWLSKEPASADALTLDAYRLRQQRALPQAQGRLQQALAIDPHHRRALIEMGILYEALGMPERALVLYERAVERDPQRTDIVDRLTAMKARGIGRPLPD